MCADIGTSDLSGELRGRRDVIWLGTVNSQEGRPVDLAAEPGCYACWAEPLRKREEVVI
jgi:hypothetical protein